MLESPPGSCRYGATRRTVDSRSGVFHAVADIPVGFGQRDVGLISRALGLEFAPGFRDRHAPDWDASSPYLLGGPWDEMRLDLRESRLRNQAEIGSTSRVCPAGPSELSDLDAIVTNSFKTWSVLYTFEDALS